jgi:hypothetical protein
MCKPLAILLLLGACITPPPRGHPATVAVPPAAARSERVVVQNRYYAKAGKAEEVYQWRVHACDVLVQLGLNPGHVFRGTGGVEPDAVWQVELDPENVARETQIERDSPAFQEVMEHMGKLIRRFERSRFREERLFVNEKPDQPLAQKP